MENSTINNSAHHSTKTIYCDSSREKCLCWVEGGSFQEFRKPIFHVFPPVCRTLLIISENGGEGLKTLGKAAVELIVVKQEVLHKICDRCKLKLIEKVDDTASLFSRTLTGQNVCVLLKSNGNGVNVDAKSESDILLSSFIKELKLGVRGVRL